ncbi:MAG: hypothetical protein KQA41_02535, partial [Candidatus Aenigmarchaeota archaeon]|nr:hypothetical protein [Candidatus Aenigmarchaeota archaeon]
MDSNKLVADMLLIAIPIAAIILFISLSWKVMPTKCWENLNGTKSDILKELKKCGDICWSKHDFGKDIALDDCYTIDIFSTDYNIEKKDIENLDENFVSHIDFIYSNTPYKIKIRYDYITKTI